MEKSTLPKLLAKAVALEPVSTVQPSQTTDVCVYVHMYIYAYAYVHGLNLSSNKETIF